MSDFTAVFDRLKAILSTYAAQMKIEHDAPGDYYLNTPLIGPNKKPLFFGAVQIKKNYVSFHLFPVYMYPDLLDDIPAPLKQRMQGKACFNFKTVDEALLADLAALTQQGFERLKRDRLD